MKRLFLVLFVAISSFVPNVQAQIAGRTYDRVLLPVVLGQPLNGFGGSLWTTELSITNTSSAGVSAFPFAVHGGFCAGCGSPAIPANSTLSPIVHPDSATVRGTFFYIDHDSLKDIKISLRVRDTSRALESWGTALPVVPDTRFLPGTLSIIDIPATDGFRQTLRVYGANGQDATPVRVQLYGRLENEADSTQPLADAFLGEITMVLTASPDETASVFKSSPAFLEVMSLRAIASADGYKRVRVDVTPLGTGQRIWAFVSVTANSTQHVTVLEPSRY